MEICRKLDSIRASGFPDADGVTTTGGTADAAVTSNASGPPPQRPGSEPLPEPIPALASLSGRERRPGTAASGRSADAVAPLLQAESREQAGDAAVDAATEKESGVANDGLEGIDGGGALSSSGGSAGPSPKERPKRVLSGSGGNKEGAALEPWAKVSGEGPSLGGGPESDNIDDLFAEEIGAPSVVAARTARSPDQKALSTRREKVRFLGYGSGGVVLRKTEERVGPMYVFRREAKHCFWDMGRVS